jgi:DNA polymerase-3 subunit delta'
MYTAGLFDTIYGNDRLKEKLTYDITNKKFTHAFIIEGDRGSGKHTIAKLIAVGLSETDGDKILKDICPDVNIIGLIDERKTIGINTIRELKTSVYIKPNELDIKIYIIEDAHTMTVEAQNGFLKLLEEPPPDVYFILLCENASSFLPTIKSRAPIYKTQRFNDEELKNYVFTINKKAKTLHDNNPESFNLLIKLSNGNIGLLISYLNQKKSSKLMEYHNTAVNLFIFMCEKKNSDLILAVNQIVEKRDELIDFIGCLCVFIHDILKYKADKSNKVANYISLSADKFSYKEMINLYEKLKNLIILADSNVNVNSAKMMLLKTLLRENSYI